MFTGSRDAPLVPSLTTLPGEWPQGLECHSLPGDLDVAVRTECETSTGGNPERTIVIIGSSHAFVFSTPFVEMAKKYN